MRIQKLFILMIFGGKSISVSELSERDRGLHVTLRAAVIGTACERTNSPLCWAALRTMGEQHEGMLGTI